MKKFFLSLGIAAMTLSAFADTAVFDFSQAKAGVELYGQMPTDVNTNYLPDGAQMVSGPIFLTLTQSPAQESPNGFNLRESATNSQERGLRIALVSSSNDYKNVINFNLNGGKITAITVDLQKPAYAASNPTEENPNPTVDPTGKGSMSIGDVSLDIEHEAKTMTWKSTEGTPSIDLNFNLTASVFVKKITVTYENATPTVAVPAIPTSLDVTSGDVKFDEVMDQGVLTITGAVETADQTCNVNIPVPAGWEFVYTLDVTDMMNGGNGISAHEDEPEDWMLNSDNTSFVKGSDVAVPMDGDERIYWIFYGLGNYIYQGAHAEMTVTTKKINATSKVENFVFTGLTVGQEYFGGIKCESSQNTFMTLPATLKQGDVSIVLTQEGPDETVVGSSTWSLNAASSANYQGLYMKKMTGTGNYHVATISVPDCKITNVKISYSKNITNSYEGTISMTDGDGHEVALTDGSKAATSSATDLTLEWTNLNGSDKVMLMSNYQSFEAYRTIDVTYAPKSDMPQETQKASGLEFANQYESVYIGETYESQALENPNNLEVVWSSSDVQVASVNQQGIVTIKGVGVTEISAKSAETEEFKAGNATYSLTVKDCAYDFAELENKTATAYTEMYVNFPMTITYTDGLTAWAIDDKGNGGRLNLKYSDEESVKNIAAGNVIPGGWTAKQYPQYGILSYSGTFPASTGTKELSFESISNVPTIAEKNKLVYIEYVTFDEDTPDETEVQFTGSMSDETIDFITCGVLAYVKSQPKGTYKVLAAIGNYNERGGFFGADTIVGIKAMPIEFINADGKVMAPNKLTFTANIAEMEVTEEDGVTHIQLNYGDSDVAETEVKLTFSVPTGFDALYHSPLNDSNIGGDDDLLMSTPQFAQLVQEWIPVADMVTEGYIEGNEISFPTTPGEYPMIYLFAAQGDKVANIAPYMFAVTVNNTTGVNEVEAAEADAEYYTLQGVKVANPAAGIYIKIANGNAVKVLVK